MLVIGIEIITPYISEDFPSDLGKFRDYYVELLPAWAESYQIEEVIVRGLKEQVSELRTQLTPMHVEDLIEKVTNGIYVHLDEAISDIIMVPTAHMVPLNRLYYLNKALFIAYGYDVPVLDPTALTPQLLRITKALGDEKRLQILRIIAHTPKTLTEIAKELKMSNSNMHYHLSLLRAAGIVRILNFMRKKSDLYTVRSGVFEKVANQLDSYVFQE